MKTRPLILLAGAVTLAAASALVARALMRPPPPVTIVKEVPTAAAPPAVRVLTVARPLAAGEFITGDALHWQELPAASARADQLVAADDAERLRLEREVHGAALRQPLSAQAPLRRDALVKAGDPGFLATVLLPGKRAMSIPTTVVSSNAGLVSAGDRVDVILNLNRADLQPPNDKPNSTFELLGAQTIIHDVRVLALDSQSQSLAPEPLPDPAAQEDAAKRNARPNASASASAAASTPAAVPPVKRRESATLEVSPAEAERLALAREAGTLQLALRGARESQATPAAARKPVHFNDIASVLPPAAREATPITSYRGDKVAQERPEEQP